MTVQNRAAINQKQFCLKVYILLRFFFNISSPLHNYQSPRHIDFYFMIQLNRPGTHEVMGLKQYA